MRRCLALALLVAAGCKPDYGGIELETRSTPPVPVVVNARSIELPVGVIVAVHAKLRSDNRVEYDSSYELDLYSADRSILRVERGTERGRHVLIAAGVGTTCIEVYVDDAVQECIDVVVTAPRS